MEKLSDSQGNNWVWSEFAQGTRLLVTSLGHLATGWGLKSGDLHFALSFGKTQKMASIVWLGYWSWDPEKTKTIQSNWWEVLHFKIGFGLGAFYKCSCKPHTCEFFGYRFGMLVFDLSIETSTFCQDTSPSSKSSAAVEWVTSARKNPDVVVRRYRIKKSNRDDMPCMGYCKVLCTV